MRRVFEIAGVTGELANYNVNPLDYYPSKQTPLGVHVLFPFLGMLLSACATEADSERAWSACAFVTGEGAGARYRMGAQRFENQVLTRDLLLQPDFDMESVDLSKLRIDVVASLQLQDLNSQAQDQDRDIMDSD